MAKEKSRFRLPILSTFNETFVLLSQSKIRLLKELFLPISTIIALGILNIQLRTDETPVSENATISIVLSTLMFLVFTYFFITCCRIALIPEPEKNPIGRTIKRLLLFMLWFLSINIVLIVLGFILSFPVAMVMNKTSIAMGSEMATYVMWLPTAYIGCRLLIVLPALAIDIKSNIGQAWGQSRGNGWRLLFVFGVMPVLINKLQRFIDGENVTLIESSFAVIIMIVFMVIQFLLMAVTYRTLAKNYE